MFSAPKHNHKKLETLFNDGILAEQGLGLYYTYGFVLSMVSAPELIQPSEWFPVLFKSDELPKFKTEKEAREVLGGLLSIWQYWADQIRRKDKLSPPRNCSLDTDGKPTEPLRHFCLGYLMGLNWLDECWTVAQENQDDEYSQIIEQALSTAMIFCSIIVDEDPFIEKFEAEFQKDPKLSSTKVFQELPLLLLVIAEFGRKIYLAELPDPPSAQKDGKIGRNAPCPCGSDKKYKKCCLN